MVEITHERASKRLVFPPPLSWDEETVWLTRAQMADLFDRDVKTIGKHINNALKEELDNSTVAKFATVQTEGGRTVERQVEHYNFRYLELFLRLFQ